MERYHRHVFIHAGNDDCIRSVLQKIPELTDTLMDTNYRTNTASIVAAMVREGVGITAVAPIALPIEFRKNLIVRKLIDPEMTRTIYLIRRRDVVPSPATTLFINAALTVIRTGGRKF